jgi:hypothetical protein
MPTNVIIQHLNAEIDRLTRALVLLTGSNGRRHRSGAIRRRRPMSPETKAKIGAMMRRRWAERRAKKK